MIDVKKENIIQTTLYLVTAKVNILSTLKYNTGINSHL